MSPPARRRAPGFSTLGQAGMRVPDIVSAAGRSGVAAVELRLADGEVLSATSTADDAARVGGELRAGGVRLLALCTYVPLAADADDGGRVDTALAHQLALADAAGAPGIRVFMRAPEGDRARGDANAVARLRRVLPTVTGAARVLVETHDSHLSGASIRAFFDVVPSALADRVGVVWDTAHTWRSGEELEQSARLLAPWLAHVQVKDVAARDDPVPVGLGRGAFPIHELARALDVVGYDGPVSLEWERTWHQDLAPLAEALARFPEWAAAVLDDGASVA